MRRRRHASAGASSSSIAGEYWACHETLEALWIAERRPVRDLYQGVLQVGVAFHHLKTGNYPGAVKMLRRGLPRLRDLPEICQGLGVAELYRAARADPRPGHRAGAGTHRRNRRGQVAAHCAWWAALNRTRTFRYAHSSVFPLPNFPAVLYNALDR